MKRIPLLFALALLSTPALAGKKAAPCKPGSVIEIPAKGVRAVAFTPDGKLMVTGNVDGTVRIFDAKKGRELKSMTGHKGEVYSLAISPDGKLAASGGEDKNVVLWDLKKHSEKAVLKGHNNTVKSVAFTPDGKTLLSASLDRQLGSWDVENGKLNSFLGGQACLLTSVSTSTGQLKDGSPLAGTACNDGLVRVWNLRTGKPQFALEGHDGEVHAVTFAKTGGDNPPMASGDNENKVIIWDVKGGKAQVTIENVGWTDAVAFSPDGKILVAAGNDMAQKGLFKIFDVETGKLLNEQFPHDGNIPSVAFAPDGKTFVTAGMDETVKVWDVATVKKGCGEGK